MTKVEQFVITFARTLAECPKEHREGLTPLQKELLKTAEELAAATEEWEWDRAAKAREISRLG